MIILTREETIMKRLQEQYNEALEYFPETRIVGIFLQGSQNYLLDYENSDIDSKLVVLPSFEDICNEEEEMKNKFQNEHFQLIEVDNLLNNIQYAIMKRDLCLI